MGDPKKSRRKYSNPKKRWDKKRIEDERKLLEFYGLKNKKELRMVEALLRKKRHTARKLLAAATEERIKGERVLIESLQKIGVLKGDAHIDDVLGLGIQEFLERRLQTIVWRKNLAKTIKQARQFIVHGHIAIGGRKVSVPSYLISPHEENEIKYFGKPMIVEAPKAEKKESMRKKFEEVREEAAGGKEEAKEETEGPGEKAGEKAGAKEKARKAAKKKVDKDE